MKVKKWLVEGRLEAIIVRPTKKKSRGISLSALRSLRGCFGKEASDDEVYVSSPGARLILVDDAPAIHNRTGNEIEALSPIWDKSRIKLSDLLRESGFLRFGHSLKLTVAAGRQKEDVLELL